MVLNPRTDTTLIQKYRKYYESQGHIRMPPYSLLHPAFKTSFVLSAGVIDMKESLSGNLEGPIRRVLIQPCFRHFDTDRVASRTHLSLFLMGGALYFDKPSRTSVLEPMVSFFLNELRIDPDRLWLSAFAGGSIEGHTISQDEATVEAWSALGMPTNHLVLLGPDANFWREGASVGQTRSGICGPHAEVFFDLATRCQSDACLPGCACGRFLELGNAVFPQYELSGDKIRSIPPTIAEGAVGLDRLAMVVESATTIFHISSLKALKEEVSSGPLADIDDEETVLTVIDHVRAYCCLIAQGALPGREGRGHILRKMLRKCWNALEGKVIEPSQAIYRVAELVLEHNESHVGIDVAANWQHVYAIMQRELLLIVTHKRTGVTS